MPSHEQIRQILEGEQTVERLAAVEHERWAHWQQYVHDQCELQDDGSLIVPAKMVARWQIQIETAYSELSDQEQESDREQVRRYLPVVLDALNQ